MTRDESPAADAGAECGGCGLRDALHTPAAIERRTFLKAAALAMTSIGVLGFGARDAGAMPVGMLTAIGAGSRAGEKRYPIPAADGVAIDRDNSVIIARANGKVYAFALSCPHQNTALRWNGDDHEFQCPKHHSRYREDGTFIDGRATRNMDRLPLRREGAEVVVDVDHTVQQDESPAQWAGTFVAA